MERKKQKEIISTGITRIKIFSKVWEYSQYKKIYFVFSHELLENKISKNDMWNSIYIHKSLGIILTKKQCKIGTQNYKTLLVEIKDNLSK